MGASSSKPEAGSSQHVFSSNSPVQFSSNLVEALQSTSETDSSRAKALELEIQNRVAQELKRLQEREQQTLAEIEKRLSEAKDNGSIPVSAATAPVAYSSGYPAGSLNLDAPRIPFAGREYDAPPVFAAPQEPAAQPAQPQPSATRELSRDSVLSQIDVLRNRLDGRRKLVELDEGVEKAKADVVSCLRVHDRRPLDCWKEVENFKKEVAKMEAAFVDRVVG
ncbi:hypothetical protein N7539_004743 [Penicillium diatomitis]|uniref:Altered inheritance of mitochondria protein 13, mitochondrial n=1 Tax=Penicillium diatomitis TaxID=2819901 RepID=A0A9X0BUL1_9EURO|nr:uncharacterized protein N7539_004743 [Penicillium diatomitis]KAJ5484755.1 hypothetical protein N7539_004743 [Penicillium diatomitis]